MRYAQLPKPTFKVIFTMSFSTLTHAIRQSGKIRSTPPGGLADKRQARKRVVALNCIGCEKFDGSLRMTWGENTRVSWGYLHSGSSWPADSSWGPMRKLAWQPPAEGSSALRSWGSSRGP